MPDVNKHLRDQGGDLIFITLNLPNRLLKIPLTEEVKEKSAFVTEDITTKFERMSFGLNGASDIFQKLLNIAFQKLDESGVIKTYLDNIIIPSANWDKMIRDLQKVLEALVKVSYHFVMKVLICNINHKNIIL